MSNPNKGSESTQQKIVNVLVQPALAGAVAAGVTACFVGGGTDSYSFLGIDMPLFVTAGVTVLASSVIAESIEKSIPPDADQNVVTSVSAAVKPVLCGLATAGICYATVAGDMKDAFMIGAVGAGSQVAGSYMYDNFVRAYVPAGAAQA